MPFLDRLLSFFDQRGRDLPWRRTTDPWAIWVSEVMLQQTRVEAVKRSYARFLERFPDPGALAAAEDDALLTAWQGLGYYRRARLLREAARAVQQRHGGRVPSDPDALGALPGIGAYTLGAVASIAFGHALPAIDGNVERVLARHRGIDTPIKTGAGARLLREIVTGLVPADRPGDFNQALMELGATVCTPRSPRCDECPVATDCVARLEGRVEELPVLPARKAAVEVGARAVVVPAGDAGLLAHRIPVGEINAGQLDLPGPGPLVACPTPARLSRAVRQRFGVEVAVEDEIGNVRHGITHHRITLTAHWASCDDPGPLLPADPLDPEAPWTTIARKVFALSGFTG